MEIKLNINMENAIKQVQEELAYNWDNNPQEETMQINAQKTLEQYFISEVRQQVKELVAKEIIKETTQDTIKNRIQDIINKTPDYYILSNGSINKDCVTFKDIIKEPTKFDDILTEKLEELINSDSIDDYLKEYLGECLVSMIIEKIK